MELATPKHFTTLERVVHFLHHLWLLVQGRALDISDTHIAGMDDIHILVETGDHTTATIAVTFLSPWLLYGGTFSNDLLDHIDQHVRVRYKFTGAAARIVTFQGISYRRLNGDGIWYCNVR